MVFFESSSTQMFKTMNHCPNTLTIDDVDYYPKKKKKPKFNPIIILNESLNNLDTESYLQLQLVFY